jgi:hypothetical protein
MQGGEEDHVLSSGQRQGWAAKLLRDLRGGAEQNVCDAEPGTGGCGVAGEPENSDGGCAVKVTKKRGKRGEDRKALFARISPAAYLRLCEIAGERTLADALNELLMKRQKKPS